MLFTTLITTALLATVNAQTIVTSSAASVAASTTIAQSMPPSATAGFNPALVNSSITFNWCRGQLNNCPQICGGAAAVNLCDSTALTYSCTCPNGTVPDCTAFANTLPFFICQQTYIQCVAAHPNDAQAQQVCTNNMQCGTRNATAEAVAVTSASQSTTSTSASSSSSATGSASGSSSASGSAASASSTGLAINVQHVSTGALTAVLLAAFKLFV